jgi:hypothetical protein
MRLKRRILSILCLSAILMHFDAFAQDTIRIMQYNVLRYGQSGQEPAVKNPLFINIINYIQPDIVGVNEINTSADYGQTILSSVFNINGITYWKKGKLSLAGQDKSLANNIYYNSEKFTLLKQDTVSTIQREITAYNFMYNDSNLVKTKDTIFFTVIVLHFKAGNTSSDESIRGTEAMAVANYLNAFPKAKNVMVMGDYNVYTNTEAGFNNLVSGTNDLNKLKDPINRLGTWNNNASYADIHTQSTHTTQTGGFSSGGMDDRFDIMLCTNSLIGDSLKMRILPSTYVAVGNDGKHFNLALNASPTNTSVPADVLNALYNMSDHIPIRADFVLSPSKPLPQGISADLKKFENQVFLENPVANDLKIHVAADLLNTNLSFQLYDINGKRVISLTHYFNDNDLVYALPFELEKGVYILKIKNDKGWEIQRKLLKK